MCVSALKSMTDAQRAKRVLRTAGISCEIVNLDRGITKRGCAYGVSYPCSTRAAAVSALARVGLDYGEVLGEE